MHCFGDKLSQITVTEAYEEAKKSGFSKPYIFDTSQNKLIDLGYIPYSPFYDEPEWR
jgi:hypothetical protein